MKAYTRSDLQPVHVFKIECLKTEERFRDYHPQILSRQRAPKRAPRNTLLGDETPRSGRGLSDAHVTALRRAQVDESVADHTTTDVTDEMIAAARTLPSVARAFDISFTRTVSNMRRDTEAKLKQLEYLQNHYQSRGSSDPSPRQSPPATAATPYRSPNSAGGDSLGGGDAYAVTSTNFTKAAHQKALRASAVTALETSPMTHPSYQQAANRRALHALTWSGTAY